MSLPRIAIVKVEALAGMNGICQALGLGTGYFTRALCAIDPEATDATPPTHWMVNDLSAQIEQQIMWQNMAMEAGLPSGPLWGQEGVISAEDAQAALAPGNLRVYTAAGENDLEGWTNGTLLGLGLQFVPEWVEPT